MVKEAVSFQAPAEEKKLRYQLSEETFTVQTVTDLGVRKLARRCGIKKVQEDIRTRLFPEYSDVTLNRYRILMIFQSIESINISLRRIDELLTHWAWEAATLRETLSFFELLPDKKRYKLLREHDLVALGSRWARKRPDPKISVPFITRHRCGPDGKKRRLSLCLSQGANFTAHDLFLVRTQEDQFFLE
jgi:hypothetical protein